MEANEAVNNFRDFLIASWESFVAFNRGLSYESIDEATIIEERTNDWFQANWEMLVESSIMGINEFLLPYGNGADCNGASSRVIYPDKLPTHKIVCSFKSGDFGIDLISGIKITSEVINEVTFDRFAALTEKKDYFIDDLPFDCVLLEGDKDDILLKVEDVYFKIKEME